MKDATEDLDGMAATDAPASAKDASRLPLPPSAEGPPGGLRYPERQREGFGIDGVSGFMGMRWDDPQTVRLRIRPELINAGGLLSGVTTFALIDYCMGSTLWAQRSGKERIATINIAINYIQTATKGEIVCKTELDRRNKTSAVMRSEVRHEDGRLLATAIGSYAIFIPRERGEAAPDTRPGTAPDTPPGTGPDTPPEAAPDTRPGTAPDTPPEAAPDTRPGTGPDTPPGTGPDTPPEAALAARGEADAGADA